MANPLSTDPRYAAHLQYHQFVEFAKDSVKEDAISANGKGILVVAKSGSDFVGNIFRTSKSKSENDAVRERFKSAILGMFCVEKEEDLPDSVRAAMKLGDYGKGKPLTARRIRAVQTVVDKYFADKTQPLMAEAVRQGVEDNETTQKLVREAVRACVEDPEALEIVTANIKDILVESASLQLNVMRPVHGVRGKVDAITANLRALRTFAQGDQSVLAAGKEFVHLPTADFNALMATITTGRQLLQPHLDQLLRHPHGVRDLDIGVRAFAKAIDETMARCTSGLGRYAGTSNAAPLKALVIGSLLHRDGDAESVYHELQVMLHSDDAKHLKALYRDLANDLRTGIQCSFDGLPDGLRQCMADHAEGASACLDQLNDAMYDHYKIPANERRPVAVNQGDTRGNNDFGTLGQALQTAGRDTIRADRDAFLREAVKGSGAAADQMRTVFSKKIDAGTIYRPSDTLKSQSEGAIRNIFNYTYASGLRKFQNPEVGMKEFKSVLESFYVTLPGGTKLSIVAARASDQLAEFVTQGEKKAFKDLTPSEKNKVYIVMSFISQGMVTASYDGSMRVLDPTYDPKKGPLEEEKHKRMFSFSEDVKSHARPSISLELRPDGGLKVGFRDTRYICQFRTLADNRRTYIDVPVAEKPAEYSVASALLSGRPLGSTVGVACTFELTGDAVDRLAGSEIQKAQIGKTDLTCSGFQLSMSLYDPQ